jgi:hypothetical protein
MFRVPPVPIHETGIGGLEEAGPINGTLIFVPLAEAQSPASETAK